MSACNKDSQDKNKKALNPTETEGKDAFLWLEEVEGDRALDWVHAENNRSLGVLENDSRYTELFETAKDIFQDTDRIAYPRIQGDKVYNFWQDADHVQGIWRRSSLRTYLSGHPNWELVLDVDALAQAEGINWVFKGAKCLAPENVLCLVELSDGGTDASYHREFNLQTKTFVEENAFSVPEAKSEVTWLDENTLILGTDWGAGSLTESGYPRVIKVWQRGTPMASAQTILEGAVSDVYSTAYSTPEIQVAERGMTFYTSKKYLLSEAATASREILAPESSEISELFKDQIILRLRDDWTLGAKTFKEGSLVSLSKETILNNDYDNGVQLVFEAQANESFQSIEHTKNQLIVNYLSDVKGKIDSIRWRRGRWVRKALDVPENGAIEIVSASDSNDALFFSFENFLQPESLYYMRNLNNANSEKIASLKEYFDSSDLVVKQEFATSPDGTQVPYFIVHKNNIELNGHNPTWLYAYGGFEISMRPFYNGFYGKAWLEKGGVYVLANIRGGGEYGPAWHKAALKENRQRAYDDFFAVAEQLISTGYTSPQNLAISGGSNGGLLMGVALTQRPDLFNAIACWVPLLDMIRYVELPPGASWIGEYGDPRIPEEKDFILGYSPYQNMMQDKEYPEIFFLTSTKDDRVHPGHARKMAAKMQAMGHDFLYYENVEGGHGASANLVQSAKMRSLQFIYFYQKVFPQ